MLQINEPCPVSMNQLQKTGTNCYFCKGCSKEVIDFTEANESEILAYKGQKICGIYRNEQLEARPVFHWRKAILFRFLAAASFLGFTISPVQADTQIPNDLTEVNMDSSGYQKSLFKPKKKKKRNKHYRKRTIGAYV